MGEFIAWNALNTAISSIYVDWQGKFGTLLGDAKTRGPEALPEIYHELWTLFYLIVFWVVCPPIQGLFRRWYCLRCDQQTQRAYVSRWPAGKVPEGTGQRLHEDVGWAIKTSELKVGAYVGGGGLRECWMWIMDSLVWNAGQVYVFFPKLLELQTKFKPPTWIPGPPAITQYWVVILVFLSASRHIDALQPSEPDLRCAFLCDARAPSSPRPLARREL